MKKKNIIAILFFHTDWDCDTKDRPASVSTDAGSDPPLYEQPRSYDCIEENT